MVKKEKDRNEMENTSSEAKTEKKINALFERTADEIFYDFFKKYGKWVLGGLTFLVLCVLYGTHRYNRDLVYEQNISEKIISLLESDNRIAAGNQGLVMIKKDSSLKEKHKATLLYLVDISSKETLIEVYKETKKLKYVCQYPFTTYHFKYLVVAEELLYLKVLYFLGIYGLHKEMKEFFLEKKMQSSVFSYYANYLLAIFTKDNFILKELFIGHGGYLTNSKPEFVYYTKLSEEFHGRSSVKGKNK